MRNADGLESTDADRFSRLHAASQQDFDSGHLSGERSSALQTVDKS
jgi:hypothetical protein